MSKRRLRLGVTLGVVMVVCLVVLFAVHPHGAVWDALLWTGGASGIAAEVVLLWGVLP